MCWFPWKMKWHWGPIDRHHVTYNPPREVNLCRRHHEQITVLNGQLYVRECANWFQCAVFELWLMGYFHRGVTIPCFDLGCFPPELQYLRDIARLAQ